MSVKELLLKSLSDKSETNHNKSKPKETTEFEEGSIAKLLVENISENTIVEDYVDEAFSNAASHGHYINSGQYKYIPTNEKLIRGKKQSKAIEEMLDHLDLRNDNLSEFKNFEGTIDKFSDELEINTFHFPEKDQFEINEYLCSKNITHITYDIETNKQYQRLEGIGSLNYEAKRVIISAFQEDLNISESIEKFETQDGWQIWLNHVKNPVSNLALINIETILAATILSALQQGEVHLIELVDQIIKDYPLRIDTHLLEEMLNLQRISLYIAHHAKFDLNQIKYFDKEKNHALDFINYLDRETVTIEYGQTEDKQQKFEYTLGNIKPSFRMKLRHTTRFNTKYGQPIINIFPHQKDSVCLAYSADTIVMAFALMKERKGLKYLSEGLEYEKFEYKEEKKFFNYKDFYDINEESYYLMFDLLSTLNVYFDLANDLIFEKFEKMFDLEYELDDYPFPTKINSNATISKHNLKHYLKKITNLDIYTIKQNIKEQSKYFEFFNKITQNQVDLEDGELIYTIQEILKTYLGGLTETQYRGVIVALFDEILAEFDFEAQYPMNARLCNAMLQFVLASENRLHEFLEFGRLTGTEEQRNILLRQTTDLLAVIERMHQCVLEGEAIEEDNFLPLNGVCRVKTKYKLLTRMNPTEFQKDKFDLGNSNLDIYATGTIDMHLARFAYSVIDLAERKGWTIQQAFDNITILEINLLNFDSIPEKGDELFTKYVILRGEYPKSTHKAENQFLKINANSTYGIPAEGISKKAYEGQFYLPSIPSSITGFAELQTRLMYLRAEKVNCTVITGDTDSGHLKGKEENLQNIPPVFERIDPLEYEGERYEKIWVLGRKKYYEYGEYDNCPDHPNHHGPAPCLHEKEKTHGAGIWSYRIKEVYHAIHSDVVTKDKQIMTAIKDNIHLFPFKYQVNVKNRHRYKLLSSMIDTKKSEVQGSFILEDVKFTVYKDDSNLLVCNNDKELIKGQFFSYTSIDLYHTLKSPFYKDRYYEAKYYDFLYNFILDNEILQDQFSWDLLDSVEEKKYFVTAFNKAFGHTIRITRNTKQDRINDFFDDFTRFQNIFNQDFLAWVRNTIREYDDYETLTERRRNLTVDKIKIANFSIVDQFKIAEFLVESKFINDEEAENLQIHIDLQHHKLLNEIDENLKDPSNYEYLKRERRLYLKKANRLKHVNSAYKHLKNRFVVNNIYDRYYRNQSTDEKQKLEIAHTLEFNHPSLPVTVNRKKYKNDNVSFKDFVKLPNLNFTAKLLADQNKYWSQAIINAFSLNGSIQYAKTHGKNTEEWDKYFDSDYASLPCPKKDSRVWVRLNFRKLPKYDDNLQIEIKELLECHTDPIKFTHNKKPKTTDLVEYLIIKDAIKKINDDKVKIIDIEKYNECIIRTICKNEFTRINFIDDEYSVEIVNNNSLNYNATLTTNVVVHKRRMFFADLRFNPSTDKMINFKEIEFSPQDVKENSGIVKQLLMEFMNKIEFIKNYSRENQTFVESLEEEKTNYLDIAYMTLATMILKQKINQSTAKIKEFHITEDIETKHADLVTTILEYFTKQFFDNIYREQDVMDEVTLRNAFNFQKSGQNNGIATVNWQRYTSNVIYSKSYNQLANKIKRVTNKNNLTTTQLKHLREQIKKEDGKIRVETQLKHEDAINDLFNYQKHETTVEVVRDIIKFVEETIQSENKEDEVKNIVKTLHSPPKQLVKSMSAYFEILKVELVLMGKYKVPKYGMGKLKIEPVGEKKEGIG